MQKIDATKEIDSNLESTATRTAGGFDFTAKGGKRQGREVPQSLRVKPGAKPPVWKTQSCDGNFFISCYILIKKRLLFALIGPILALKLCETNYVWDWVACYIIQKPRPPFT
jgi:hypothetical protein